MKHVFIRGKLYKTKNSNHPLTTPSPKFQSLDRINHLLSVYPPTFSHNYTRVFNKYVLSSSYMPGTILGTRNIVKQKHP